MKVLDTTFLIDLLRGDKGAIKIIEDTDEVMTTQINMYEVIRGLFFRKISKSQQKEVIELFETIGVLGLDDYSLIKSAEASAALAKQGLIISDCDCMTAGIALSNGINKIVTKNAKHFKRIKGVKVVSY